MDLVGGSKKGFKEEAAGRKESLAMVELIRRKYIRENIRDMGPALALLLATLIISTFITEFTFNFGLPALWKTLFRFLRLTLVLTLPLLLLPYLCTLLKGFFKRGPRHLIRIQEDRGSSKHPMRNWIIRPFQGIGLVMLLATRLLSLLEVYSGSKITVDTILPQGAFNAGRFLSSVGIGMAVSLLLSFLWTLDGLGVRYYNKKTKEVRVIGKYVGQLLPILFGFYGIISLFDINNQVLVIKYVAQMVIILYPPFVIFSVIHSRYTESHRDILLARLKFSQQGLPTEGDEGAPGLGFKSANGQPLHLPYRYLSHE